MRLSPSHTQPYQYSGHVISLSQSEAVIQVTWSALTNQIPGMGHYGALVTLALMLLSMAEVSQSQYGGMVRLVRRDFWLQQELKEC